MPVFTRTNFAHEETLSFDSGRGKVGFFRPSDEYFGMQETPHDNKWNDGTSSFLPPVSHYHLRQAETFYVAQGSGKWILNGKAMILSKGDSVTIPARSPHRFESVANAEGQSLICYHRYKPQHWEMEERFLRNISGYMWDCYRAGIEPSIMQLCIFSSDASIAAEVFRSPVTSVRVECLVNTVLTWFMAAIGLLLGYKRTYPEYYDPVWSAKRAREHKEQ